MSSLPTTGVLGGSAGLGTDGILGATASADEDPISVADASTRNGTWLLDLVVGGRILRYSTRSIVVFDRIGRRYLYKAGLADFEVTLDGLEEQQGITVIDSDEDWPLLVVEGYALATASATLRRYEINDLLESARIVLDGAADEPEYGDPDSPTRLTITLNADLGTDRTWPSPSERVDETTWAFALAPNPTYDEQVDGAIYPTIFGYPGEGDTATTTPRCVIPGLLAYWDPGAAADWQLLISRGALDAIGGVALVIDQSDGFVYEDLDVEAATDALGQPVTIVVIPPGSGVRGDLGHKYYVGLSRSAGRGGGSVIPGIGAPLSTLAEVALFCGRNSGRFFDEAAQEGERIRLDKYRIDGTLNTEVQLVPWFESELMPLFPVARARTSRGMYWRHINYWATPLDAVAEIDTALGWRRTTSTRSPTDAVRNYFTIDFALASGLSGGRRILTAQAEAVLPWWFNEDRVPDFRIAGSPACFVSQSVYGVREALPIKSDFVWKETTASLILDHFAVRDTFPRSPVSYQGPASEIRHLRAWDVVTVTDPVLRLSGSIALVRAVRMSSARLAEVDLEVLDPQRLG